MFQGKLDRLPGGRIGAPWLVHDLSSPFLVFKSDLLQNQGRFVSDGVEYDTHHSLSRHIDIVLDPGWSIDHGSCVEQCRRGGRRSLRLSNDRVEQSGPIRSSFVARGRDVDRPKLLALSRECPLMHEIA